MEYTGYTQGHVISLKAPLPVPNGTEVEISIPPNRGKRHTGREKLRVVSETFSLVPADVSRSSNAAHPGRCRHSPASIHALCDHTAEACDHRSSQLRPPAPYLHSFSSQRSSHGLKQTVLVPLQSVC